MKRIFACMLAVMLIFAFCGCGKEQHAGVNSDNTGQSQLKGNTQNYFNGQVLAIYDDSFMVKCTDITDGSINEGAEVSVSKDIVSAAGLPDIQVNDTVRIVYTGAMETCPLQLHTVFAVYEVDDTGNVIP